MPKQLLQICLQIAGFVCIIYFFNEDFYEVFAFDKKWLVFSEYYDNVLIAPAPWGNISAFWIITAYLRISIHHWCWQKY